MASIPPMTPAELADVAQKYAPGLTIDKAFTYKDRYLFVFKNPKTNSENDQILDARICLNSQGETVPFILSDPSIREFMKNSKEIDSSEFHTIQHYGRKGMKWYQHIFGDEDPRAAYNKKGKGSDSGVTYTKEEAAAHANKPGVPDDEFDATRLYAAVKSDGGQEFLKNLPKASRLSYSALTQSYKTDMKTINPHYRENVYYQENCGLCMVATEMNKRGYLVEARPKCGTTYSDIGKFFNLQHVYQARGYEEIAPGIKSYSGRYCATDVADVLRYFPENSRGMLVMESRFGGHFTNFERTSSAKNKYGFRILDGQSGEVIEKDRDIETYFGDFMTASVKIARLDNAEINPDYIQSAVKPRKR